MKYLLIVLALWSATDPLDIAKVNKLKKEAKEAYANGDFEMAVQKYRMLHDSLGVDEDEIAMNLAHSYYALKDTSNARTAYEQLTTSSNNKLKSIAYQQLGVMAKTPQTLKQSLAYLKSALKSDPTNEGARYDYEVVKKLLEEQEKQKQDQDQNQDQENKDQQNKDEQNQEQQKDENQQDQQDKDQQDQNEQDQQKNQEDEEQEKNQDQQQSEQDKNEKGEQEQQEQQQQDGEKSEEEQQKQQEMDTKKKLEEMNISEEKARMILEAMRNNEIQYIQQQKRKPTKRPDTDKPDW